MKKAIIKSLLSFLLFVAITNCNNYPDEVTDSLKIAGDNKIQLENVLKYYENDSLKLKAAYFLIANMKDKVTYVNELRDGNGKVIDFNISDFKSQEEENKWLDSIEIARGILKVHEDFLPDLKHISSQFLINNIDNAFLARKESPFCRDLSDKDFYEYILPYRVHYEKLEFWRDTILNFFTKEQKDSIYNFSSTVEATRYINNTYKKHFKFGGSRYFKDKKIRSYSELIDVKIGKCSDMCNLIVFALRALGIPSGFDGIRYKRASNDVGHEWCFVIDTKLGKTFPFDALSKNNVPGDFHLPYKNSPKVLRRQFAIVEKNSIKTNESLIHPDFYYANTQDVTSEYFETINMSIATNSIHKTPVYLNIWYKNEWKPIDYSYNTNTSFAKFQNVTKKNLYCLSFYHRHENKQLNHPFIVNLEGEIQYINSFEIKKRVEPSSIDNHKIKIANKGAEIYDFLSKKKICTKKTKNDYDWVYVAKDSLTTNTFYIFSDSYRYGKIIFINSDGNIEWF